MEIKIIKGTSVLDTKALYNGGRVYIPAEALESPVGLWGEETVFFNSPLAGKRICVTVLSPDTYADRLPPALEHFLALCTAAGAQIIYNDGGIFPPGDLILAIEPGGRHVTANYLGAAFRNKPLAFRITANLKRGLKLAYLPDPVPFNKPQYNLKISFGARFFTPAIAVQWPDNQERIGPWLFSSLMEYFGSATQLDGDMFAQAQSTPRTLQPEPVPAPVLEEQKQVQPETPTHTPEPINASVTSQPKAPETPGVRFRPATPRISAAMSRAQYPDFFAALDLKQKRVPKKEPFS